MVNIQSVQIAGPVNIAKTDNGSTVNSDKTVMSAKRPVPRIHIHHPGSPCIHLLLRIIPDADSMHRIVKQFYDSFQIAPVVSSDFHGKSKRQK